MRIKKCISALLSAILILITITACSDKTETVSKTSSETPIDTDTSETVNEIDYSKCDEILSGMSTEEKIAQKLMPTFRYFTNENGELSPVKEINGDISDLLGKHGFSGVILFAQNISSAEQTVKLIDDMQTANTAADNRPQLFVGVDQEGGSITRIDFGTSFCGNMALAATGDLENAKECGSVIGSELSALGFNVDFAPVVDVNSNPSNPVIGTRSFSDNADTAAEFGSAFMQGIQSQGISAALKHFPGHGDTSTDSHTGLPCIYKNYDELKSSDLVPFKKCADLNSDMIMTAHIQFPNIETETYTSISTGEEITLPATLSKKFINDILRTDMNYDGVVITDAMQMDAIAENFDRLDSAQLAFNAGVDILLMPMDTYSAEDFEELSQYISDIAELADNGTISMESIDNSVLRILRLKQKRGLLDTYNSDVAAKTENAKLQVGSADNHNKEWKIAKKSVTLVKNDNNALPVKNGKTVIVTAYSDENNIVEYAIEKLKDDEKLSDNSDITVIGRDVGIDELKVAINDAENVIALSEVGFAEEMNPYSGYGSDCSTIDTLIDYTHECGAKFMLISCDLPYDAARYQNADSILIAWSSKGTSEDSRISDGDLESYGASIPSAVYLAFSQTDSPTGKLPVDVPKLDDYYEYSSEILYQRGFGLTY